MNFINHGCTTPQALLMEGQLLERVSGCYHLAWLLLYASDASAWEKRTWSKRRTKEQVEAHDQGLPDSIWPRLEELAKIRRHHKSLRSEKTHRDVLERSIEKPITVTLMQRIELLQHDRTKRLQNKRDAVARRLIEAKAPLLDVDEYQRRGLASTAASTKAEWSW